MRPLMKAVFAVCVGLTMMACSDDTCDDFCKRGNECGEGQVECDEFCGGIETVTDKNCGNEYDKLKDCYDEADDICAEGICEDEFRAFGACVLLYCGSDFDEPGCDDIRDGLSS